MHERTEIVVKYPPAMTDHERRQSARRWLLVVLAAFAGAVLIALFGRCGGSS
ncbi:hypothetical protein [Phenylobacterium sp.]|uniref:hypothetical protein n=1 Tax=Phenylobacterium sp. TaxID=1871053 RepID=UPI0025FCC1C6|nr:hypothetical protein [Phenylobacterium sp.]